MSSNPRPAAPGRLGFISDIHGDLPALQSVLAEMVHHGVKEIYVAGDLLLGGEQPLQVWQRLMEVGAVCSRGPSDTALVTVDPTTLTPRGSEEERAARRFARTRDALGELVLRQLGDLPLRRRFALASGHECVVVHGSPRDPSTPIGHELDDEEVRHLLGDDPAEMVVCGGTHLPFEREIDGVVVINVGSVGESPAGNCAGYTIIDNRAEGPAVEQYWVEHVEG
jgi:predicted phosphodiesterase